MLSDLFDMQMDSSEVSHWKNREQSYGHNGEQSKIYS